MYTTRSIQTPVGKAKESTWESEKKSTPEVFMITLANLNRFTKLFTIRFLWNVLSTIIDIHLTWHALPRYLVTVEDSKENGFHSTEVFTIIKTTLCCHFRQL